MAILDRYLTTPLRRAIFGALLFAVATTLLHGVFNAAQGEAFFSWSPVLAALMFGLMTYLQASGRNTALATFFISLGGLGLVFWIAMIATGALPASRADWPWVAIILGFPVLCIVSGFRLRRRVARGDTANIA